MLLFPAHLWGGTSEGEAPLRISSASILGVVGAGGIGFQLADRIRVNEWPQVGFLILMILATVTLINTFSNSMRARLIERPLGRSSDL